jgi:peptide deformylase
MAVFPIRQFGDPVLRQKATEVTAFDDTIRALVRDLCETMYEAPGVGLAANQIGVLRRVIVWSYDEDEGALVNPRIVAREGAVEGDEACLSLPGLAYPVIRAEWVRVEGQDKRGRTTEVEAEDMVARILQHEIDHLDGVLFTDRLPPELQREARRLLREIAMGTYVPPKAGPVLA